MERIKKLLRNITFLRWVNALRKILTCFRVDLVRHLRYSLNYRYDYRKLSRDALRCSIMLLNHQLEKAQTYQTVKEGFGCEKLHRLLDETEFYIGKYGVDDITGTTVGILEGHFANPHAWKDETTKERFLKIKEQCPANSFYGGIIQYTGKSIKKFPELAEFLHSRRSCRTFAPKQVDPALLQEAVRIAQSAPSACNRQPIRVHIYNDPEQIRKIVYAQHADIEWCIHAPVLIVISANEYYYRDYLERNQKMFDAGLFAMTLNLVLHNMEIGSCFKMAQKYPCYDRETKAYAEIPEYEDICVLMPAGYYPDSPVATAKSIRISENIVCKVHK